MKGETYKKKSIKNTLKKNPSQHELTHLIHDLRYENMITPLKRWKWK